MEQAVFFDLEVRWEGMLVPAEQNTRSDGFNVHRRSFQDPAVLGGIFDDFLMEHLVFAPTGDGVKFFEAVRKRGYIEIAPDEVGGIAILFAGLKIFADHELKKPDRIVGHGENINESGLSMQGLNLWRNEHPHFIKNKSVVRIVLIFNKKEVRIRATLNEMLSRYALCVELCAEIYAKCP